MRGAYRLWIASAGHTFYGSGDTSHQREIARPGNGERFGPGRGPTNSMGKLHAVRSYLSLASLLTFLFLLAKCSP